MRILKQEVCRPAAISNQLRYPLVEATMKAHLHQKIMRL